MPIKEIYKIQKKSQDKIIKKGGVVTSTPEFDTQFDLFDEQIPLIYEKLYEFVKKHIDKFP